jgi:hypothetical protein
VRRSASVAHFPAAPRTSLESVGHGIVLTAAQAEQLTAFVREKQHEGSVLSRRAEYLGALEAVLLDGEGP